MKSPGRLGPEDNSKLETVPIQLIIAIITGLLSIPNYDTEVYAHNKILILSA